MNKVVCVERKMVCMAVVCLIFCPACILEKVRLVWWWDTGCDVLACALMEKLNERQGYTFCMKAHFEIR